MTPAKRLMDLVLATILAAILLLPCVVIGLWILITDGRPVLYLSERMKTPSKAFTLFKFRTMRPEKSDSGVSSGYKETRITKTGRFLRRKRLDELPQLLNILIGDMSFVGPRPPLRRYVELRPNIYKEVLRNRPGVTGLATLVFHRREEALLANCRSAEETETVYLDKCVPTKARLDITWAGKRTVCYDMGLLFKTAARVLLPKSKNK